MSFDYLNEAFKKLSFLNEETFDTSLTGLNQLSDFMDQDASDDVVKVIDTDAEFEDEVQDSYIGKVITNCNVCHSHIFENKDEIVIDEDGLVNAEKQCPYCGEQAGFTIVGEITPYVNETEETAPEVAVDGTPVEDATTPTEEPVDESVLGTLGLAAGAGLVGGAAGAIGKHVTSKILDASDESEKADEEEDKEPLEEGLGGALVGGALGGSAGGPVGAVAGAIAGSHIQNKLAEDEEDLAEAGAAVLERPREKDLTKIQGTIADVLINHSAEIDACGANETAVKDCITRILGSDEVKTPEAAQKAIRIINKCRGPKLWSTIGTYMSGLKVASSAKYARRRLDASMNETFYACAEIDGEERRFPFETRDQARDYIAAIRDGKAPEFEGKKIGSLWTESVNKEALSDSLTEDVNNVNVETDDSIVNIHAEEGGKVTVSTEPKAPEATGDEAIGPLSDETLADIESANGLADDTTIEEPVDGESAPEEEVPAEGEEEMDIDEVDETALDELGESYLKEVYENVDSFKTSNVSSTDTHLVVEGVIKFKSGATKKTGFIFEAHSVTPDGKVRFTGKNEHFSRGAKSFILTGKIENKKLISESFTYNYRAKTADGKSNRIYGTVSKK